MGGTEVGLISKAVSEHFKNKETISLLDVGIGDGFSLSKILKEIEAGHTFAITGVDPVIATSNEAHDAFPEAELIGLSFEEYVTDKKFDVVNARQSLYYLKDKETSLETMFGYVAQGGLLLITNWAEQDIFCRLHESLFPNSEENITGEEIIELIRQKHSEQKIEVTRFEGKVDIGSWKRLKEMAEAAITIISREEVSKEEMPNKIKELQSTLDEFDDIETRTNLVISVQKG